MNIGSIFFNVSTAGDVFKKDKGDDYFQIFQSVGEFGRNFCRIDKTWIH